MAIKIADDMFGDGTAGNPQVPIDLLAPPGFNANNRGVAFGEQVTSAIKNRTPYALVLNDEDLNTRLTSFEVSGLDAAYDLGTLGPAGGGRTITKDAGAVETVSALGTQYEDDPANAGFRANMSGDSASGGTGFDAVAALGEDTLGFIDRVPVAFAADTIIPGAGSSATLNPGGAGVDRCQLNGGNRWKLAAATDLVLSAEIVEISGGGVGVNGLYFLGAFISDTVLTLVRLDGTAPTFGADAAVTATIHRRKFSSNAGGASATGGALFHGRPGETGTVNILPGAKSFADTDGGATTALSVDYADGTGAALSAMFVDLYGRIRNLNANPVFGTELDDLWGQSGHFMDKSNATTGYEAGFIFQGGDIDNNYAYVALSPIDNATIANPETFDFTATADEIDVTGAASGLAFQQRVAKGMTICQIVTPSAQAGYYYVNEKVGSDTTVIQLRKLDGTAPVFPGAGAGTIIFFSGGILGKRSLSNMDSTIALVFPTDVRPAMTIMGGEDATGDGGGLYIGVPFLNDGPPLVCYSAGNGITDNSNDRVLFGVTAAGFTYSFNNFRTDGEFAYNVEPSRQILLNMSDGLSDGFADWNWSAPNGGIDRWASLASNGAVIFPFKLPTGSTLQTVEVAVEPGLARTATNRVEVAIRYNQYDFATPTSGFAGVGAATEDDGTTNEQVITIGSLAHAITGDRDYFVEVRSGNTGAVDTDFIYAIRLTFDDPGPRNF